MWKEYLLRFQDQRVEWIQMTFFAWIDGEQHMLLFILDRRQSRRQQLVAHN